MEEPDSESERSDEEDKEEEEEEVEEDEEEDVEHEEYRLCRRRFDRLGMVLAIRRAGFGPRPRFSSWERRYIRCISKKKGQTRLILSAQSVSAQYL